MTPTSYRDKASRALIFRLCVSGSDDQSVDLVKFHYYFLRHTILMSCVTSDRLPVDHAALMHDMHVKLLRTKVC